MASRLTLIVSEGAAKAVKPSKDALYNPALGDRHEAALSDWGTIGHVMLSAKGLHLSRKKPLIGFVYQHAAYTISQGWPPLLAGGQ